MHTVMLKSVILEGSAQNVELTGNENGSETGFLGTGQDLSAKTLTDVDNQIVCHEATGTEQNKSEIAGPTSSQNSASAATSICMCNERPKGVLETVTAVDAAGSVECSCPETHWWNDTHSVPAHPPPPAMPGLQLAGFPLGQNMTYFRLENNG